MYVAVAVAMATAVSVRALISRIMSSTAKRIPPTGVLKVAAMPPAAPAAISVEVCQSGAPTACPMADPKEAPI